MVLFDNLANGGRLGNSALDPASTARTYRGRVLGKSEMTPPLDLMCVFFGSGSNVQLVGDVVRGIVPCRLESPLEKREERTGFAIKDIAAHTVANRGELVCSALTILRGFILAGKPDQSLTPMDFVAWSALVRNAVKWSTGFDPWEGRADLADANPEVGAGGALVEAWHNLQTVQGVKGFTVADVLRELRSDKAGTTHPALRDALAELWPKMKPGDLPSSGSIGMKIQSIRGQVFGSGLRTSGRTRKSRSGAWKTSVCLSISVSSSNPRAEKTSRGHGENGYYSQEKTHQTHQTPQHDPDYADMVADAPDNSDWTTWS